MSLTSVTIPESVTSIGEAPFAACINLFSITVDEKNEYYDSRENCNAIIEKESNKLVSGCLSTIIPNSVTTIGKGAFLACKNMVSVEIPNNVTTIEGYAFSGCSDLVYLSIPESVTVVGDSAFVDCQSLNTVYCNARNVPQTSATAFLSTNIQTATLYVPVSAIEQYRTTAPWNGFGTISTFENEPVNEGDVFTALTDEGVEMIFKVISDEERTVQVWGDYPNVAISQSTVGPITIPSVVSYMGKEFSVTSIGFMH